MYTRSSYIFSICGHTSRACGPHVNVGHSLQTQSTVTIGSPHLPSHSVDIYHKHRRTWLCHSFLCTSGLSQPEVNNVMSETQTQAAILLTLQSPSQTVAARNQQPGLSHTQPTLVKGKVCIWLLARMHYSTHRYRL